MLKLYIILLFLLLLSLFFLDNFNLDQNRIHIPHKRDGTLLRPDFTVFCFNGCINLVLDILQSVGLHLHVHVDSI